MDKNNRDMKRAHEILNYSFAHINIGGYVNGYFKDRNTRFYELFPEYKKEEFKFCIDDPFKIAQLFVENFLNKKHLNTKEREIVIKDYFAGLIRKIACGRKLSKDEGRVVNRLQQLFSVRRCIYDKYDINLNNVSDYYKNIECYAWFSVFINLRFLINNNFNDLNTAVKLNDLILYWDWKDIGVHGNLIFFCIKFECGIIRGIYEK